MGKRYNWKLRSDAYDRHCGRQLCVEQPQAAPLCVIDAWRAHGFAGVATKRLIELQNKGAAMVAAEPKRGENDLGGPAAAWQDSREARQRAHLHWNQCDSWGGRRPMPPEPKRRGRDDTLNNLQE
jgi:hypothetical protein